MRITRRAFHALIASGTAAVATGLGPVVRAQSLAGSISVGYQQGHVVEPFVVSTAEQLRAANPDAEIELKPFAAGDFTTQLVLQLAMGQAPDVFLLSGAVIAELASSGMVAPLDSWLDTWDGWEQYPSIVRDAITWEGSVWGLPYPVDMHFLYYRRDLFTRAGLPVEWQPSNPDDILSAARTLKDSLPDVIPYALYAGANGGTSTVVRGFIPVVAAFGGTLTDESGLWIIDSCPIRQALSYYERAFQVDQTVPQDVMTGASPVTAMRDAMGEGTLGILYDGCWNYQSWLNANEADTLENIGYAHFPRIDGSPFSIGGIGNSWFINARCENPELAWAYLAAFNSRENHVALNSGDPHIPARSDAAADPVFQSTEFLQAMIASSEHLLLAAPDPAFRELIAVVQNATGIVASGDASPEEAVERYASELGRILGEDRVTTAPPCGG